jgi:hypothetical protein
VGAENSDSSGRSSRTASRSRREGSRIDCIAKLDGVFGSAQTRAGVTS